MDEQFTGTRFFVFDGKPVKTIWEDGIVIEVYIKEKSGNLKRNYGLAFYITTETAYGDDISEKAFNALEGVTMFDAQK
ncbi:MAG: hypothetical protein OIF40_15820 [Mangrovicoccus sp.]|nr:hypothetical protein [Mangrovicoccus sp.]